jgi:uncharacterized protein (TIGR03435 family)
MIATVYNIDPSCVDIPDALNGGKRYDFVLVLPKEESDEAINGLIKQGIKKHFQLTMNFEAHLMDVFVLTAPDGADPSMKVSNEDPHISLESASMSFQVKKGTGNPETDLRDASIIGITAAENSMKEFCNVLEKGLNRPVIDETGLKGRYDFEVRGDIHTTDEFLQALRERLGLVLTPKRQKVKMLAVRPI